MGGQDSVRPLVVSSEERGFGFMLREGEVAKERSGRATEYIGGPCSLSHS